MSQDDEAKMLNEVLASKAKARGYANFFGWSCDRDLEEIKVVETLCESLKINNELFFLDLKMRGRNNDPPDCEALNKCGERIAIEVTELVDGQAIHDFKKGAIHRCSDWNKEKFISALNKLINRKDKCYPRLKDGPYQGGYVVVVFTDEIMLSRNTVVKYLRNHQLDKTNFIDRAFLVFSFDTNSKCCPYYEISFS